MVTLPSGLRLRIAESGDRGAPGVVLLHGWGASLYMWRDWFAPLAAAGRRVIAIDLPGHGLSDKPEDNGAYRTEALVHVVRDVLAAEGLAEVDIIAQSMAGTIAVELLATYPASVRRLMLVNPACFGQVRLARLFPLARATVIDRVLPRLVRRSLVARTHRLQYDEPSTITRRDEDEYWAPSQFPSYTRAMRRLVHLFQWTRPPVQEMAGRLRACGTPLLVVLGGKDGLVRDSIPYVAALRAAGVEIESHVIARGAHAVNEERPAEIASLALRFLE